MLYSINSCDYRIHIYFFYSWGDLSPPPPPSRPLPRLEPGWIRDRLTASIEWGMSKLIECILEIILYHKDIIYRNMNSRKKWKNLWHRSNSSSLQIKAISLTFQYTKRWRFDLWIENSYSYDTRGLLASKFKLLN